MFLADGKKKFLLDFDGYQYPFSEDNEENNQWLNMRLILLDGSNKFEAVSPALTVSELYDLSRWVIAVRDRPFKVLEKTAFTKPELTFEYFPDDFDIEKGSCLKITFAGDFVPKDSKPYVLEGHFSRAQLANCLRHIKTEYYIARNRESSSAEKQDTPGRKFREFLFYNFENPDYEYLHDKDYLDEVEKNIDSIESSYKMLQENENTSVTFGAGLSSIGFISVVAGQRANLFDEYLSKLLKVAAIPYPAWYMIYSILGKTALYYKLYVIAIEIFSQAIKTANAQKDEPRHSVYQVSFEKALSEYTDFCRGALYSVESQDDGKLILAVAESIAACGKIDITDIKSRLQPIFKLYLQQNNNEVVYKDNSKHFGNIDISRFPFVGILASMLPFAFYFCAEYGANAFDNPKNVYLIYNYLREILQDILPDAFISQDYTLAVCCIFFCAILVQLIYGNPLYNDILKKVQKQLLKFERYLQAEVLAGYTKTIDLFHRLFSEDFGNLPQEALHKEVVGIADIVSVLETAIWCILNSTDFESAVNKAKELCEADKNSSINSVSSGVLSVLSIIAYFEYGGEGFNTPESRQNNHPFAISNNFSEAISSLIRKNCFI